MVSISGLVVLLLLLLLLLLGSCPFCRPCEWASWSVVAVVPVIVVLPSVCGLVSLWRAAHCSGLGLVGLEVCWSRYQQLPVAPVSGFFLALPRSRNLVLVYAGYLKGNRVPCPFGGAGCRPPDVGPVPWLDLNRSGSVFSVIGLLHLFLGPAVLLSGLPVVSPSGGCRNPGQLCADVPIEHQQGWLHFRCRVWRVPVGRH